MEKRVFYSSMLILGMVMLLCSVPLTAQDNNTTIHHATRFAVSPPLRDLAKLPSPLQYGFHEANPVRRIPKRPFGPVVDTVEQRGATPSANYTVGTNFLGVGNGFPEYSVPDAPPDTNMAVGDTQIVQWVNVSYTVCSEDFALHLRPGHQGNTLWSALGGICASQQRRRHHRAVGRSGPSLAAGPERIHWPYGVCVAISTSPDATGTYYLYAVPGGKQRLPRLSEVGHLDRRITARPGTTLVLAAAAS